MAHTNLMLSVYSRMTLTPFYFICVWGAGVGATVYMWRPEDFMEPVLYFTLDVASEA